MASRSLRPEIATKRAGCRAAAGQLPCFLPRRPLPGTPTLPSLPVALNTALCTDSVPPCGVPCRQPNQSVCPTGSASSSQEGPFPYFPSYSSAPEASTREQERERERKHSAHLHSPASPSSPVVCHALFQTAARQRRGLSPRPEESFFGDGRAREGKGQFLQKTPLPLSLFPRSTAPPQQKSGAVTCTRFYRKNKGTWMCYFFSPLCLRLWPCCMK